MPPSQEPRGPPRTRPKYETLLHILTSNRWKNGIIDVEADPSANITTDHSPLTVTTRFKLKKIHRGNSNSHCTQYKPMTGKERTAYNELISKVEQNEEWHRNIDKIHKSSATPYPKRSREETQAKNNTFTRETVDFVRSTSYSIRTE